MLAFDQLPQAIAGFDVAIAPLIDKPGNDTRSDIKLKEYAIAGVPWLASPYGPYVDYGEEQGGWLVEDDQWSDALNALISDGKTRKKLAKRGQKWAKDQTLERNVATGSRRSSRRWRSPRSAARRGGVARLSVGAEPASPSAQRKRRAADRLSPSSHRKRRAAGDVTIGTMRAPRGRGWQRSHTYVPRPAASSLRTAPPHTGHGSPARRCTRKRSWKEPRAPSRSRKSSMLAPFASIPSVSASRTASRSASHCARVSLPASRSGWTRARKSASSA